MGVWLGAGGGGSREREGWRAGRGDGVGGAGGGDGLEWWWRGLEERRGEEEMEAVVALGWEEAAMAARMGRSRWQWRRKERRRRRRRRRTEGKRGKMKIRRLEWEDWKLREVSRRVIFENVADLIRRCSLIGMLHRTVIAFSMTWPNERPRNITSFITLD